MPLMPPPANALLVSTSSAWPTAATSSSHDSLEALQLSQSFIATVGGKRKTASTAAPWSNVFAVPSTLFVAPQRLQPVTCPAWKPTISSPDVVSAFAALPRILNETALATPCGANTVSMCVALDRALLEVDNTDHTDNTVSTPSAQMFQLTPTQRDAALVSAAVNMPSPVTMRNNAASLAAGNDRIVAMDAANTNEGMETKTGLYAPVEEAERRHIQPVVVAQTKPSAKVNAKRPPAVPTPMRKELGSPRKRNCVGQDVASAVANLPVASTQAYTHRRSSPRLRGNAHTEQRNTAIPINTYNFVPLQENDGECE